MADDHGATDNTNQNPHPVEPAPHTAAPASAQSGLHDPIEEDVGLVIPPEAKPLTMKNEIADILKAAKLPERRGDEKKPAAPHVIANPFGTAMTESGIPLPAENAPSAPITPPKLAAIPVESAAGDAADEQSPVTAVHTLKQDLRSVVQVQKMSMVRAAALEAEKKSGREPMELPARPHASHAGTIFAIFVLLLLGIAALGGVYLVATQSSATIGHPELAGSLVFAEQTVAVSLAGKDPTDAKAALASAKAADSGALGSFLRIVPTVGDAATPNGVRAATFSEFMTAIGATAPADLVRALNDRFFLGVHTVDKNAPFIVVPVTSYDRAFAAMLTWEKTMNSDLAPLFTAVPSVTYQNGVPADRTFQDLVMRNFDVRALKDDSGTIELYYSFPSQKILIIAESPYSFSEIINRLQAQRLL